MASSFSIALGNFLYKNSFPLYKAMYSVFKKKQDAFEIELLKKHIKPGQTILDIGANIGFYADILSQLVGPDGKIHCFEPDATNYGYLEKATKKLSNVIINNNAVGPKTETIKIYTSKNLNVDHRTYKPDDYDEEIEIQAVSIDDYLGINNKIDFIKIDIQGFEMQAMKGMTFTLNANPDLKMISEFWPYGLRKAGSSLTEYFSFFKDKGFNVYLLEKNTLKLLSQEKVKELEGLGEEHYFNIFITKERV
jgi:FkbM family methyltransferase